MWLVVGLVMKGEKCVCVRARVCMCVCVCVCVIKSFHLYQSNSMKELIENWYESGLLFSHHRELLLKEIRKALNIKQKPTT